MKCVNYLLGVLILLFIFSSGSVGAEKKKFTASIDQDGVQKVDVFAGEYFFDPDYIIVKVNIPVEIKIKKEPGIVPHNFVIKSPEAGMDITESLATEPKTIRLIPAKTGKYPFYCDKKLLFSKSHREKGMEGTIEVFE